jgi:hypothetical protein
VRPFLNVFLIGTAESVLNIVVLSYISTFIGFVFSQHLSCRPKACHPLRLLEALPPLQAAPFVFNVAAEAVIFDQAFVDNYDLDIEGGDEYPLGQKMVHYCGGIITQSH